MLDKAASHVSPTTQLSKSAKPAGLAIPSSMDLAGSTPPVPTDNTSIMVSASMSVMPASPMIHSLATASPVKSMPVLLSQECAFLSSLPAVIDSTESMILLAAMSQPSAMTTTSIMVSALPASQTTSSNPTELVLSR